MHLPDYPARGTMQREAKHTSESLVGRAEMVQASQAQVSTEAPAVQVCLFSVCLFVCLFVFLVVIRAQCAQATPALTTGDTGKGFVVKGASIN